MIGCSALKESYLHVLRDGAPAVSFAWLTGPRALLAERLRHRVGHFMNPALLDSQLQTLEEPRVRGAGEIALPLAAQVRLIQQPGTFEFRVPGGRTQLTKSCAGTIPLAIADYIRATVQRTPSSAPCVFIRSTRGSRSGLDVDLEAVVHPHVERRVRLAGLELHLPAAVGVLGRQRRARPDGQHGCARGSASRTGAPPCGS